MGATPITLGSLRPPFEYKYARGDWKRAESDGLGKPQPNRKQEKGSEPLTIVDEVYGWEDLPAVQSKAHLTVILDEIPGNTPWTQAFSSQEISTVGCQGTQTSNLKNWAMAPTW